MMPTTVQQAQAWATQWNWNPFVIVALLLISGIYVYGVTVLRQKHHLAEHVPTKQMILFLSGIVVIALAIITPLQALTSILFTGHMIQHMVLSFIVAPLLVLGIPDWLVKFCVRNRAVHFSWRWLTAPAIAAILFNANIWIWHAPVVMNGMMMNEGIHLLALALYVVTGVCFWWPLCGAQTEGLFSLNIAEKLIYILLSDMPMVLLGAGLTFMPPFYTMYEGTAQLIGWSPTTDQQLGGLIMWIPGGIYLIGIASILLIRWFIAMEREQAEENAALLREEEAEAAAAQA